MRKLFSVGICVLLGVCGASAQREQNEVRRELEAHYAKLAKAISAEDMVACRSLVDKDYWTVDTQGKRKNLVQNLAEWKGWFAAATDIKCTIRLKHVQYQTMETNAWYEMTVSCKMNQGGKIVPMKMSQRFCDTLRKSGNGWRAFYTMELLRDEPWTFPNTGGGGGGR